MHLRVNLRAAHVKASRHVHFKEGILDSSDSSDNGQDHHTSEKDAGSDNGHKSSDSQTDESSEEFTVSSKKPCVRFGSDIDQFVHELCKLFVYLGSPEYCHGNRAFRVYLNKESSTGDHYFNNAKSVYLKRQVGSRYYVTSCNAGRIFFLSKAMRNFLLEQKEIKQLNFLESTCLEKLSDIDLLTKAHLEGLLFDKYMQT